MGVDVFSGFSRSLCCSTRHAESTSCSLSWMSKPSASDRKHHIPNLCERDPPILSAPVRRNGRNEGQTLISM